jgi:hypothetical protein
MSIGLMALISAVAFLSASFFAGSETAIIASERIRLRHLAATGDRRARLLLDYIHNPQYFLSIVLVGTNLGMIGCTATFTAIMIELYGDSGASLATLILVPSLLVFQEILPKAVFLYYADKAALMSILPLKFFAVSLFPIIKFFSGASVFLARMFGVGKMDRKVTMTMEELLFHLQGSTDAGLISPQTMELAARASDGRRRHATGREGGDGGGWTEAFRIPRDPGARAIFAAAGLQRRSPARGRFSVGAGAFAGANAPAEGDSPRRALRGWCRHTGSRRARADEKPGVPHGHGP